MRRSSDEAAAVVAGYRHAGLRHEREQAERLQRDGLAAGVRARHQHARVSVRPPRCRWARRRRAAAGGGRARPRRAAGLNQFVLSGWRQLGPQPLPEPHLARSTIQLAPAPSQLAEAVVRAVAEDARSVAGGRGGLRVPRPAASSRTWLPASTTPIGSMKTVAPLDDTSCTMPVELAAIVGLDRDDLAAVALGQQPFLGDAAADERPRVLPARAVRAGSGRVRSSRRVVASCSLAESATSPRWVIASVHAVVKRRKSPHSVGDQREAGNARSAPSRPRRALSRPS